MKKIIYAASFLALAFVFASVEANAQTFARKFDANIQFDFAIGKEVLPAGKYTLRLADEPNRPAVLEIRNAEYDVVFQGFVITNSDRLINTAALRFDNSGGLPTLSSILSNEAGYSVPTRSQRKLIAAVKELESTRQNN